MLGKLHTSYTEAAALKPCDLKKHDHLQKKKDKSTRLEWFISGNVETWNETWWMINEWTDRWIWLMIWIGFDWIGLQALYGAAEDVWEVAEPETEQQESGDVDGHRDRRRLALALHRRPLPQRLGHGPLVQRRPQGPLGGNGRCRISHRLSRLMLVTTQRSTPINYHQSIDSLIPDVELLMMSAAPITCQLLMSRDIGLNHWFGGRRRVGGEGGRERKRVGCLRSMDERCSGGRWVNWNGFLLQLQWQEYRTPRATLLSLTADYYTISCARLTELNKKQGQDGKTGDALDVKCNIVILFFLSLSLSLSLSLFNYIYLLMDDIDCWYGSDWGI